MGTSDGYITLWKENCKTPLEIYPYHSATLPAADRQALEKGIRISDQNQLEQLLEDYLS